MALSLCNSQTNDQGRELINHGTVLFPIGSYHDQLAIEHVPWHWHDELEAAVVTKGRALVSTDTKKYVIEEGDGFFVNGGTLHGAWDVDDTQCEMHSIVFHPRLVGGSMDSVFWQSYVQPLLDDTNLEFLYLDHTVSWHKQIIENTEAAWRACVEELPGYPFQVRNTLSEMVFLLTSYGNITCNPPSEKKARDSSRIKRMLQYIQERADKELTVKQIAGSANISESECLRCFRSTIAATPIQYVKKLRLQRAAELLLTTEETIMNIGARCGFQEMSYFSKSFRQEFGCTPSQYRKQSVT